MCCCSTRDHQWFGCKAMCCCSTGDHSYSQTIAWPQQVCL
jgi:hypothetical protein